MARAKKHDRSVICFDMNMESANAEKAMKAFNYLRYIKQFIPSNENDLMKLLIFNTEHDDGQRNMYIPFSEFISYKDFVAEAFKGNKPAASNWIAAIKTAMVWLCEVSDEKKLYTLQLVIFTDLSTPLDPKDTEYVDKLIKLLIDYDIYLYILGPDVIEPHFISSLKDIKKWSKNVVYKNENGCAFTKNAISKLIKETEGIMCEPLLGIELLEIYRSTKGGQEWKCPLEIGHSNLELNVTTGRCLNLYSTPRIRATVTPSSKFMVEGERIAPDEVVSAFRIDEKIIVVPKDVRENYVKDYNGPRMFKLVAFVSRVSIPEVYMFGGEAHLVEIPAESADAHALQTLISTCHSMGRCAVVWRAYNRNNCPRLYALLPRVEPTCYFYMVPLAKASDIQLPYRGGNDITALPNGNTSTEYYKNVTKYLDLLRLDENKPVLHPTFTSGPWLNCFLQRVGYLRNKDTGNNGALPELDLGRSKLTDEASEIKEFIKNHLKMNETEEIPEMDVDEDNADEW